MFSDRALEAFLHDPGLVVSISTYKGLGFVLVTSLLLFLLVRWAWGRMDRHYRLALEHEAEVERLSRLYSALSQINQAIVRTDNREDLLKHFCEQLTTFGGFDMAWFGWCREGSQEIAPCAWAGEVVEDISSLRIAIGEKLEEPFFSSSAFNEGRTQVLRNVGRESFGRKFAGKSLEQTFHSLALMPVEYQGKVAGVLAVYARESGFFRKQELLLLEEAVDDLTFALEAFDRDDLRQQAQAKAESEEAFSRMMIESMPGIVYFYDSNGRFLRWNRNFERISGYTGKEIANMQPPDFFAKEDHPILMERIGEVFSTGESYLEAPFVSRSGSRTPYHFTGRRVQYDGRECLVGVGVDISERRLAALALQESERKYRELVEYANSIIVRWDSQGTILLMNEFGLQFFGYSEKDLIGKNVMGSIVPYEESSGRNLKSLIEEITSNPLAFEQSTNENIKSNGERVWISWTNRIVTDDTGKVKEILSIGADITQQRAAEQAIRNLNASLEKRVAERTAELKKALVRAESADKLKSAFLATMSHELRTPLNSIIGFTGIVRQELAGPLNVEQKKQLGMVRSSAHHLLELINDILDISKIEAGQLQMRPSSFDIKESILRVCELVRPLATAKDIAILSEIPDDLPSMLGDQRRIEQIVINLLNNAIKFSDEGEVILEISMLSGAEDITGRAVEIRVSDRGIGIDPNDLKELFQPFRQLDTGLTREHEGTGLGLAICRRLANLMGGNIQAESTPGQGSTFTVILPLSFSD